MTRVLIIGEAYNLGLSIGGGPMPGGPGGPVDPIWGVTPPVDPGYGRPGWSPVDPGYGRPDWAPGHPGNRPPGSYPGGHPGNRPPGSWSGNYPTGGPVYPGGPVDPGWGGGWGSGNYPTGGPLPPGVSPGTDVPPDVYAPDPPPENISSQYLVSVYDPKTMQWTTTSYAPPPG